MNKRYPVYISTMIILLIGLVVMSCTTYTVKQIRPDGTETTVEVKSWRNFEDLALKYTRDGEVVGFEFGAASVVTPIDAALKGAASVANVALKGVASVASTTPVGAALKGIKIAAGKLAAANEQEK